MNEHLNYTLVELETLPTLSAGQADDIKIDTGRYRVWLSRCGVADGAPYSNQVTVEKLERGRWNEVATYPAG